MTHAHNKAIEAVRKMAPQDNERAHTPTPWEVSAISNELGHVKIYASWVPEQHRIALASDVDPINAAYIVKAVNAFEEREKLIQEAIDTMHDFRLDMGNELGPDPERLNAMACKLEAALAKAGSL